MSLPKITSADTTGRGVIGMADEPGLSYTAMQEKFDELALEVLVPKFNALSEALDEQLNINEISVPTTAWTSNSHATYTKKAVIESDKFSDTFIPTSVDMIPNDGSAFFSDDETAAMELLNPNVVFSDEDVTFYATDTPATALKFRIRGGDE